MEEAEAAAKAKTEAEEKAKAEAAEKAEEERIATEKAEKAEAEKAEAEKAEAEKAEKAEAERLAKKPLVITVKDGNPIDITGDKKDKEKAEKTDKEKAKAKAAQPTGSASTLQARLQATSSSNSETLTLPSTEDPGNNTTTTTSTNTTTATSPTMPQQPLRPGGTTRRLGPTHTHTHSSSNNNPSTSTAARTDQHSASSSSCIGGGGGTTGGVRHVYTKMVLLSFRDHVISCTKPDNLPDMTVTLKGDSKSSSSSGGGGGDSRSHGGGQRRQSSQWARGSQAPPGGDRDRDREGGRSSRRSNNNIPNQSTGGGGDWSRGQAPPKQQRQDNGRGQQGGRGHKGGGHRGHHHDQQDLYDGPVEPLTRSANRWKPQKDVSAVAVTEKKVKSILNKMTKEKFDRLSVQMTELSIESSQVLQVMINTVFEKAIDEPWFGDMYANLCSMMAQNTDCSQFVHLIHGESSSSSGDQYFHWSSDISTTDSEIVGPLSSEDECVKTALMSEPPGAIARGKLDLALVKLRIVDGMFIKIMQDKKSESDNFYTVFFPQTDAEECGQQISEQTFTTEKDCLSNARKLNSFKRLLLYKCEDEFKKQDIYVEWKAEKKEFEAKSSLTESERAAGEEIEFRRIKIKKQMLGNIRFIGELFKKSMLKEPVMHECVMSLLKLRNTSTRKNTYTFEELEDNVMDEEDHEALCQLFATIGKTIDSSGSREAMDAYFAKIAKMSKSKKLPSRSRFMYQDLIDLRKNNWRSRRKEESAKTLDEIKKDYEREERAAQRQSAAANAGYRGGGGGGGGRRDDGRRDSRRQSNSKFTDNRDRKKPSTASVDEDGFSTVPVGKGARRGSSGPSPSILQRKQTVPPAKQQRQPRPPPTSQKGSPAPLDADSLIKGIKGVRLEFMSEKDEKELIRSAQEWSGTKDWSVVFCTANFEKALDCKEEERQAVISMFRILCKESMLPEKSFVAALTDILEFMNEFVVDIPKVYDYMGDVVANLLLLKAIKLSWLCDLCAKFLDTHPGQSERTLISVMKRFIQLAGDSTAENVLSPCEKAILKVISSDEYNAVKTW